LSLGAAAAAGAGLLAALSSREGAVAQEDTPTPAATPTATATPFPTVGTVPAGESSSAVVPFPFITSGSHVSVTLTSNPGGGRAISWVEVLPGSGLRVHLTLAPPSMRPETTFSFRLL
jgi:hypothetical protein